MVSFCHNAKGIRERETHSRMWTLGVGSGEPAGGNELSVYGDLRHQQLVSTRLEEVDLIVFKRGGKAKEINYV